MKKQIFLIDGSALAYRAYFAFIKNPLFNSRGENTSAVFGFANTLRALMAQQNPQYLMVAFDSGAKTFRHEKYPQYKATREKMPEDMKSQIPEITRMLNAFRLKVIEKDGVEADDIIGSIAKKASSEGFEVFIVTGDKDFTQVVDESIKIYDIKSISGEPEIIDIGKVYEKFGVHPNKIVDMLALMGDSSDNIPGVSQIGPKTASKLMADFDSIEDIYHKINTVKPESVRDKLIKDKDNAFLSKDLATIRTNLLQEISIEDFKYNGPDKPQLTSFYHDMEFTRFLKEIEFDSISGNVDYKCLKTDKEISEFISLLKKQSFFVFDTETDNINPLIANLVGISFSFKETEAYYIPLNKENNDAQPDLFEFDNNTASTTKIINDLKPIFENPKIQKCGHNIKYDLIVLSNYGVTARGVNFDTMIASYLLRPTARQHNLDSTSMFYLNYKKIATEEIIGKGKNEITMDKADIEKVAQYSCEDADITFRLNNILKNQLDASNLTNLFNNIEMPLVEVLRDMEQTGIKIDEVFLKNMSIELEEKLNAVEKNIYTQAGDEFNINSPQQLGQILFDKLEIHKQLKIKPPKKTKIGYSTDIQTLESMDEHPFPKLVLEYRQLAKLKSTYVDALPKLINPNTQRLHTSFNQTITATGRLSSSDPNLQNIPVRTELGLKIRKSFIASSKDKRLISADYSQIELRILAHLSKDQTLIQAFKDNVDIHSKTASLIFGTPIDQVTPEMRFRAKAINFGIIYGMGQAKLSRETGISQQEAKEFIDSYFINYPGIKNFINESIDNAKKFGYVTTMFGRKREIPEIHSESARIKINAEHIAVNTPIQGTCADMIKIAMINIYNKLKEGGYQTKMILQIHDELLFEAPISEIDTVTALIKNAMENAVKLDVPVEAQIYSGETWMDI